MNTRKPLLKLVTILLIYLKGTSLSAQTTPFIFLIEFKEKDTITYKLNRPSDYLSQKAIDRRKKFNLPISMSDLPVSSVAIKKLEAKRCFVFGTSKWLNAAIIRVNSKNRIDSLKGIDEIKKITFLGQPRIVKSMELKDINELISALEAKVNDKDVSTFTHGLYGKTKRQIEQLKVDQLHQRGLTGKGITIAVLDAGFNNLNKNEYFTRLFKNEQVLVTNDFVSPNTGVYSDDEHGAAVVSCISAYLPGKAVGTAYDASLMLLRTEDANNELLFEEVAWIEGAEFADSAGADLIQSSLGYNEFNDMRMNHRMKDLNGKTTLVAKGAIAACEKGLVVVNSSGNEGEKDWRNIVTPADVKNVITIGGVDSTGSPALFTSMGPTADKRIKPDVSAMADGIFVVSSEGIVYPGKGTSYACPLVSGMIACLMQACPNKTNTEIGNALRLSSSQYYDPDNVLGYGIPDALLALKILGGDSTCPLNRERIIDISTLKDKKIHFTHFIKTPQKFTMFISDGAGNEIYSEKMNIKESGVYRFSIKKSKKWADGEYDLKFKYKNEEVVATFKKN